MVGCVPPNVVVIVWTENVITSMAPACKDVISAGREKNAPNQVQLYYDKGQNIKVFNNISSQKKKYWQKFEKEIECWAILNMDENVYKKNLFAYHYKFFKSYSFLFRLDKHLKLKITLCRNKTLNTVFKNILVLKKN